MLVFIAVSHDQVRKLPLQLRTVLFAESFIDDFVRSVKVARYTSEARYRATVGLV
jgi:hypothetical protein